jgi:glycosyltransferase involved in cell wall biosynthesis
MTLVPPHISVCICTYKRPASLGRLLAALGEQDTDGLFTFSLIVVDNDSEESGRGVVSNFAAGSPVPVRYCIEPVQSIPLARNRAIAHARGEYVAVIDDDEWPATGRWLVTLFKALAGRAADGVLGPVLPHFDERSPRWVVEGKFFERRPHPTGSRLLPVDGRTGNVLLRASVLAFDGGRPFRAEFPRGEDRDFFRRSIERGHVYVWCAEAPVLEEVPPSRWTRRFMLRRALFRGQMSVRLSTSFTRDLATSIVAVPAYVLALPFALALGHHRVMSCLVRLCDHLGRLLAAAGVHVVGRQYAD